MSSLCNVKVMAQYYENYNVGADGINVYGDGKPHWKPKGGQEFIFPIESDWVMYSEREQLVEAINTMLKSQSNEMCKYEYIEHDVQFSDPLVVTGLDDILKNILRGEVGV